MNNVIKIQNNQLSADYITSPYYKLLTANKYITSHQPITDMI